MMNPRLQASLQHVADRRRRLQFSGKLAGCWVVMSLLGLGLVFLQRQIGWASSLVLPVVALAGVAAAILIALKYRKTEPDWRRIAGEIEARHPELEGRLITAVQQQAGPGGELNFLQKRLVHEAMLHNLRSDWAEIIPQSRLTIARMAHLLALVLFGVVLWGLRTTGGQGFLARIADQTVTVSPGDASIERGNSLVVLARFGGALPVTVDLVIDHSPSASRRIPLTKSLADPMFGGSVPEVTSNLVYRVEYAGQRTRDFQVTVFEHPRLERADADLTFPDYTGQPDKHIKDTRRLSAVEGSRLDLVLQLNKPVVSARLIAKDDDQNTISLLIDTNRAVAGLKQFTFEVSKTYELQLVDGDSRTNKVPAQFIFEVLKNRAPELKLASPRGDVRPSALEEISFEGTVWDDFGVQAYGLAYTLAGQAPILVELGGAVAAKEKRPFQHVLRLEDLGVQTDGLVSWFIWADDLGPDGQVRRTSGDMFFAEIRPFDEIFREGQDGEAGQPQGGGQSGGQGEQTARLAEMQKQIINATWKLQREHGNKPGGAADSPPKPINKPSAGRRIPRSAVGEHRSMWASSESVFSRPIMGAVGGRSGALPVLLSQVFGQRSGSESASGDTPRARGGAREAPSPQSKSPSYENDLAVIQDALEQALEQAQAAGERQPDPRAAVLWSEVITNMEKARAQLEKAARSPGSLAEALAAQQSAYQALLKLQQEREFSVNRNRSRSQQSGGSRQQQMQRQLEQMDLTQSENRYETQSQAQAPQNAERREQLQVMNRLQELARRQQDLNDRLKELQTALQEARTEQEREEIQRRLKRLQEEEQQMLTDVDELRQRMDRPENQSRMAEERRQLEQTRNDVQRAAEAAGQGATSQALASGTRAQRQLQELRDQMRKENSSQFAEDLRQMRAEARELARQQEDISKKMQSEGRKERRSLSDSEDHNEVIDQLARQKQRMTNLVDRATQVSQDAEEAEPLLSRQLYDTVRKFSQDSAKGVKDVQDELLNRGLMTRSLYDQLKSTSESDGAKLLEVTSELLRQDFTPQANGAGQLVRAGIDDLKRGVERAAESVLGDDTEALRLAQQEIDQLTDQLRREIAQAESSDAPTDPPSSPTTGAAGDGQRANNPRSGDSQQTQGRNPSQRSGQTAQASGRSEQNSDQGDERGNSAQQGTPGQSSDEQSASAQGGSGEQPRTTQAGRGGQTPRDAAQRGSARDGGANTQTSRGDGGNSGGGASFDLDRILDLETASPTGPITGENFAPWSDRLRDVEEMIDVPELRNGVAAARERARLMRQEFKRDLKKPDWAVLRLQVIKPLVEVRDRISEELARRQSTDSLVPIDRDPVPTRYSDLVRRYYEELGKDK